METPGPSAISQEDIDAELRNGTGFQDGKLRVYALYQQNISPKDAVSALKKEYGTGGHSHTFLDGTRGVVDYTPSGGMTLRRHQPGAEVKLSWTEVEKRLRQLIQEGSYLSPEELARTMPEPEVPPPAPEPSPPVSVPAKEITQADIDAALQEWNGDPDSKRRVQQYMADHGREKGTADWLRAEYGDDFPAFPVTVEGAATDLPWPKVQRQLARLVKEDRFLSEEERGEAAAEEPAKDAPAQSTVNEVYDRYMPIVQDLVLVDGRYMNACRNSDKENALIEGDAAVKRAVLTITEPEFMRLYHDMPDFRYRLHREIVDSTYLILSQLTVNEPSRAEPDMSYMEDLPPWDIEIGARSPWGKVQTSSLALDGNDLKITKSSTYSIEEMQGRTNRLFFPQTFTKNNGTLLWLDRKTGDKSTLSFAVKGEGRNGVYSSEQGNYAATAVLGKSLTIRIYDVASGKLIATKVIQNSNSTYFNRIPKIYLLDDAKTAVVLLGSSISEVNTLVSTFKFGD